MHENSFCQRASGKFYEIIRGKMYDRRRTLSLSFFISSWPFIISHLSGGHPLLYHEVGCHDGRGAGEPQEARDEHLAAGEAERAIDEVGARLEMLGNVGLKEVMLCG